MAEINLQCNNLSQTHSSVFFRLKVRSNHIELATQQWRKLVPPMLSTSHCQFNLPGTYSFIY